MGSVRVNTQGKLFFDFYFEKVRCREYTLLNDTVNNRRRMERVLDQLEKEIAAGTFSYSKYFPTSQRAKLFEASAIQIAPPTHGELVRAAEDAAHGCRISPPANSAALLLITTPLFTEFSDQWYTEREVDWKRSNQQKVTDILNKHLVPRFRGRSSAPISPKITAKVKDFLLPESIRS